MLPKLSRLATLIPGLALGLFALGKKTKEESSMSRTTFNQINIVSDPAIQKQEIVQLFLKATTLAIQKFNLSIDPGSTIREISSLVSKKDTQNSSHYAVIASSTETFLYSTNFDQSRLEQSKQALEILKAKWSA